MKKSCLMLSMLGCLALSANSFAVQGYRVDFDVEANAGDLHISQLNGDSGVNARQLTATTFRLSDPLQYDTTDGGHALLEVVDADGDYCRLDIYEGPYAASPMITVVDSAGMTYEKKSYSGFLSYTYTLTFKQSKKPV